MPLMLLGTSLEGFMQVSFLAFSFLSAISHSKCMYEVDECT